MKKILFISCCIPDELEKELIKYCKYPINIYDAANTFQKSLIHGFVENDIQLEVLTAPSLPTYPIGYKRMWIPKLHTKIENVVNCYVLPYFSFMLGKYYNIERLITKFVTAWINRNIGEELFIIVYNVNPAFMRAMRTIKNKNPEINTSLIVTDMIEDAGYFKANKSFLKRIQLQLHRRKVLSSYEAFDKYILLSEQMKNRIPNCRNNYIVVEGLFRPFKYEYNCTREKVIFYSGALDLFVNVKEMVSAFKQLRHNDYKLVICGEGPLASYIIDESKTNPNIIYLGSIPRHDVIKWQQKSSILINPRQPSEITKYSFPSKTMEYFASGTPVLMYKLQGIPDEYYFYCYTINGNSVENLRDSMDKVLSITDEDREIIGNKAKDFVIKHKTARIQVNKILQFLIK